MTGWTSLMHNLFSRSMDLLGPPDARCLVCGERRRGQPSRSPREPDLGNWLCGGCLRDIPWIRQIACPRCGRPVFCPDCVRQPVRAFEMNRSAVRYSEDMKKWLAMYKFRGDERYGELFVEMLMPAYERLTADAAATISSGTGMADRGAPPDVHPDLSRIAAGRHPGFRHRSLPTASGPLQANRRTGRRIWHAVTYVPSGRKRAEERGFNQAERLARAAAMRAAAPLVPLIRRLRDSGKQSMRSRAERLRAMRAAFGPNEAETGRLAHLAALAGLRPGEPLRVLLVDDIYTTGATAEACAEAIRSAVSLPVRVYVLTWARS